MGSANYDKIGKVYSQYRKPDPRISALINNCLEASSSIVNIGAGAGSYEPTDKYVSAVEPSAEMISRRVSSSNVSVYQASAEYLPLSEGSHDAAMAILTLHHWNDWRQGLREALRVARDKVLLLTWIGMPKGFWLYEYFPELGDVDLGLFPSVDEISSVLGDLDIIDVPIPSDCSDGFLCAYWARPEKYLDQGVRTAISSFSRIGSVEEGLNKLTSEIRDGEWRRKYGHLLELSVFDYGYRILVHEKKS